MCCCALMWIDTGGDGDEDHEEGAFRISVADGSGDGGEPFLRVSLALH